MSTTGKVLGPGLDNLQPVMDLDQKHFPQPWSSQQWHDLQKEHSLLFQLSGGDLQGFALFNRVKGDDTAHLLKICLRPELRGQGYATLFWREIVEQLRQAEVKSVFLEVEDTNLTALHFYRKMGFESLRLIKGFYSSGANAITMQLML